MQRRPMTWSCARKVQAGPGTGKRRRGAQPCGQPFAEAGEEIIAFFRLSHKEGEPCIESQRIVPPVTVMPLGLGQGGIEHIIEALGNRDADLAERLVREHSLNLEAHVAQHVTFLD